MPEVRVVSSEVEARRPGRSAAEALYLDPLVCTVDVGTLPALTCRCGSRRSVERLRLPDLGRSLVLDYRGGLSAPLRPPTRGGARARQCDRSLRAVNTAARAAARRSAHSPTRFAGTPASPRANTPKDHATAEGGCAPSRHPLFPPSSCPPHPRCLTTLAPRGDATEDSGGTYRARPTPHRRELRINR